jgi:hypothetical protein
MTTAFMACVHHTLASIAWSENKAFKALREFEMKDYDYWYWGWHLRKNEPECATGVSGGRPPRTLTVTITRTILLFEEKSESVSGNAFITTVVTSYNLLSACQLVVFLKSGCTSFHFIFSSPLASIHVTFNSFYASPETSSCPALPQHRSLHDTANMQTCSHIA